MKKLAVLCLILLACVAFCACSGNPAVESINEQMDQINNNAGDLFDKSFGMMEDALNQAFGEVDNNNASTQIATESTTTVTESATPTTSTEPPTQPPTESVQNQFDECAGMPLPEFMKLVDELGYKATYYNQGVDYTEILSFYTEEDCESFLIGSVEENTANKTVIVDLLLKTTSEHDEAEASLKEKLDTGSAWVAAENYGEALYGDFELNYFFGKIEEYAEDADTWFLKAECTAYGVEMTCEARVTGTNNNPEVIYFDVY